LWAIDGSKFKAVNNRAQNFTCAKMQRRALAVRRHRHLFENPQMPMANPVPFPAMVYRKRGARAH